MTNIIHINNIEHLRYASDLISQGEIVVAGFNGIYGIFGDADNIAAAEKILKVKERPTDKNLILVSPPEFLSEFIDTDAAIFTYHSLSRIQQLYREVHALGVILPASTSAPSHLVKNGAILNIWTEYLPFQPFRKLIVMLREKGTRALVGTSANKSGCPTFIKVEQVCEAFDGEIPIILSDCFEHLPSLRQKSTTVLDCTTEFPRLHRAGNVTIDELRSSLKNLGFKELLVDRNVITVKGCNGH